MALTLWKHFHVSPCLRHVSQRTNRIGWRGLTVSTVRNLQYASSNPKSPGSFRPQSLGASLPRVSLVITLHCVPDFHTVEKKIPLSDFAAVWHLLPNVSQWVLNTITKGYRIRFASRPPSFRGWEFLLHKSWTLWKVLSLRQPTLFPWVCSTWDFSVQAQEQFSSSESSLQGCKGLEQWAMYFTTLEATSIPQKKPGFRGMLSQVSHD